MEKLALKETILLKKIQLLQEKLHLVRAEMEFERKFPTSPERVFITPSSEMKKVATIPECPATGKESSNPEKAVDLPKIQNEVQTSVTLGSSSSLNLRPNGGIPIPPKTEDQTSAAPYGKLGPKAYYVVYNGPYAGIYTTWTIAEQAISGFSGVKHKKYKSFEEARVSANLFTTSQFKAPLDLISSMEGLKPTYAEKLTTKQSSKVTLGTVPKNQYKILTDNTDDIFDTSFSGFKYLFYKGRKATEQEFVSEHFFTTDKKNISYFNFYANSHPDFVYETYQYGLLALIYPASNLLEISRFPKEFREAVKSYKRNCLKNQDKEIYLKFQSTNTFWNSDYETPQQSYHYVQMGVVKEKIYSPSQDLEAKLEEEDLQKMAEHKLLILINKVFSIKKDDKIKVNLATPYCLITSFSHKGMSEKEYEQLKAFQRQLTHSHVFGFHLPELCLNIIKEVKKYGLVGHCSICTTKSSPTTKDKAAVVEEKDAEKEDSSSVEDKVKEKEASTSCPLGDLLL